MTNQSSVYERVVNNAPLFMCKKRVEKQQRGTFPAQSVRTCHKLAAAAGLTNASASGIKHRRTDKTNKSAWFSGAPLMIIIIGALSTIYRPSATGVALSGAKKSVTRLVAAVWLRGGAIAANYFIASTCITARNCTPEEHECHYIQLL